MPSLNDRSQTDRAISAAAAGLGRATPYASPRWLAVDDVRVEVYY